MKTATVNLTKGAYYIKIQAENADSNNLPFQVTVKFDKTPSITNACENHTKNPCVRTFTQPNEMKDIFISISDATSLTFTYDQQNNN